MSSQQESRLRELCEAMVRLSREAKDLETIESDPEAPSATLRFTSSAGAIAQLAIDDARVEMTTWSGADHEEAGASRIQDVLGVHLHDGFGWDDVTCGSAEELARLLLKHMYRRTGHAAPDPPGTDGD